MSRQPIAIGFGEDRSRPLMASRVINLYPIVPASNSRAPGYGGGKVRAVHYGTPGLMSPVFTGAGPIRAMWPFNSFTYVLAGVTLYRVDQAGVVTQCSGAAMSPLGTAMMTNNRMQLGILVNGLTYYVTAADPTVVALVTSANYPTEGASSIDYVDGYIVWVRAGTDQFFVSALNDITTIDALDFATAESSTDGLVRVLVDHRLVRLFGTETTEIWANTGASSFPLERINGALIEVGCAAAASPASLAEVIFWLGSDRIIYRSSGYQGVRISTDAIEEAIRTGTVSDAFGMAYTMGGHQFYVITFPSLDRTFCYDVTTGIFHERRSDTDLVDAVWNVNCIVESWGKVYAGTSEGRFCEIDLDTYADHDQPIRRVIRSSPFFADGNRAVLDSVEVEMELGTGINTGQGSDPQIMMRWSDDGGATWSNQRTKSFGPTGQRRKRVVFRKLGIFRQRMLEFSITDPVKVAVYGMKYTPRVTGA